MLKIGKWNQLIEVNYLNNPDKMTGIMKGRGGMMADDQIDDVVADDEEVEEADGEELGEGEDLGEDDEGEEFADGDDEDVE